MLIERATRRAEAFLSEDYEEVSVGAAAVGLTMAKVDAADIVFIRFSDGPTMIRVDGTDPTAAVGVPMFDGDNSSFSHHEAKKLKMIRQGATNGVARATYYRG